MSKLEERLTQLSALKDGWAGGGGKAITPFALEKARTWGALLGYGTKDWPSLVPTLEGGVEFEWLDQEKDTWASLEILPEYHHEYGEGWMLSNGS